MAGMATRGGERKSRERKGASKRVDVEERRARKRIDIGERRARERRTPSTSATRFNYTLQTHDMSKSYTSYRLCHLLKVSSRAPRSRHRCSAVRPLLPAHPENIQKERFEIYERKVREKSGARKEEEMLLKSTQLQRFTR